MRLRYRHDTAAAVRLVDSALTRYPLDSLSPGDRPYDALARFYAAAGRAGRARALLARAPHRGRVPRPDRQWSLGVLALAERRTNDAERSLRTTAETHECPICVLPDLAHAYEAAGQADSAIAVYERYLATPWQWRFETHGVELGWSLQQLALLHERRGDGAQAAAAYRRLIASWRDADAELQRVVAAAQRRVHRADVATDARMPR